MPAKRKLALALTAGTLLLLLAAGGALYAFGDSLSGDEQVALSRMLEEHGGPLLLGALAIVVAFFAVLRYLTREHLMPAITLAEDIRIIQAVNPAHRVDGPVGKRCGSSPRT